VCFVGLTRRSFINESAGDYNRKRQTLSLSPAEPAKIPWGKMLTDLPNLLTLSRIAAIPLLIVSIAADKPEADLAACAIFALAAITDYFDGRLARSLRQQSDIGRLLDPIADKLLVGAAVMMLVGNNRLSCAGLYPAIVIMLREILVSGLREYLAEISVGLPVAGLAKWKTGFQMVALGVLLGGSSAAVFFHVALIPITLFGEAMLWIAAGLTIITGWDYLVAGVRHAALRGTTKSPTQTH
jgi:cardiolipin synthase